MLVTRRDVLRGRLTVLIYQQIDAWVTYRVPCLLMHGFFPLGPTLNLAQVLTNHTSTQNTGPSLRSREACDDKCHHLNRPIKPHELHFPLLLCTPQRRLVELDRPPLCA
jgi:hypothetical protein